MRTFYNKWFYFLTFFIATSGFAQVVKYDKNGTNKSYFDGFYLGANIGYQNIFGGAFINDLDLLTHKSGLVFELTPGYRLQFLEERIIFGVELYFGFTDGDLQGYDSRYDLDVFYKSHMQSGFGLLIGVSLGKNMNNLFYFYSNVTRRTFDIKFTERNGSFHEQKDEQNFLRYGLGFETSLINNFNIRASIGMVYVDFGNLVTSQDVEDKNDINIGVVYQF